MDAIVKILLEYGLTGVGLVVLGWYIIKLNKYIMKVEKDRTKEREDFAAERKDLVAKGDKNFDRLEAISSRMAASYAENTGVLQGLKAIIESVARKN